jgi:hypothetical protein
VNRYSIPALILAAMATTVTAQTQVYRCTSASGAVEYRQTPCTHPQDREKIIRTDDALSGTDPDAPLRQLDAMIADLISRREYDKAYTLAVNQAQRDTITTARNADPTAAWQAEYEIRRAAERAALETQDMGTARDSRTSADGESEYYSLPYAEIYYSPGYWRNHPGQWHNGRRHPPGASVPDKSPPRSQAAGPRTLSGAMPKVSNVRRQAISTTMSPPSRGTGKPPHTGRDPEPGRTRR